MKLVTQEVYEKFVEDLINVEGLDVEDTVEAVEQVIDEDGAVRAQVIYFSEYDREPQFMIDKRIAWDATLRAAQAQLAERTAVIDAVFPQPKGIAIDD